MNLAPEKIKEISEFLGSGMLCYIHKETHELNFMPEPDNPHAEPEHWQEDWDMIENDPDSYFRIESMSSRESFRIMDDFAEQVEDRVLKAKLLYALSQPRPFQKFKYELNYHQELKQAWFEYRDACTLAWITKHVKIL